MGPSTGESAGGSGAMELAGEGMSIRWRATASSPLDLDLQGVGFLKHGSGDLEVTVRHGSVRRGSTGLTVVNASCNLSPAHELEKLHAERVVVEWLGPKPSTDAPTLPATSLVLAVAAHPHDAQPAERTTSAPLFELPDPHALRSRLGLLVTELADRLPVSAEVGIDALSWKTGDGDGVALTIGPGLFSLRRAPDRMELRYAADTHAESTSMSVRALLPTGNGDPAITLEGGPLALSTLGVQEGAGGLLDVAHATVGGRAHIQLAGDGSAATFDLDVSGRSLSLRQPRLATETVRGMDVELRTRGVLGDSGNLRIDDLAMTFGLIHVAGSGVVDQQPDHASAAFQLELPSTASNMCSAMQMANKSVGSRP